MKRLYLIRHAKSRKDIPGITDGQRPLSDKGVKDALYIGKCLKKAGHPIAALYSSPARRALDTAKLIAREIGFPGKKIEIVKTLYDSNIPKLLRVIKQIDNAAFSAVVFGHNPEFFNLVNYLTTRAIDKFPTAGVYGIDFNVTTWRAVSRKKGKIAFIERPKK
jgi:phosphohistidine phosphatase